MIRRPLMIFATLVAIVGLVGSAGWYYARHMALIAVDDWAAAQRASGTEIGWAARQITGWPLRLDGRFAAPRAVTMRPGRTLIWQGPDTRVRFYLFDPNAIDMAAPGRHRFSFDTDGTTSVYTLDSATLDARADTGLGGLNGIDLAAGGTGLVLRGPQDAPLASAQALQLFWHQPPASAPPDAASDPGAEPGTEAGTDPDNNWAAGETLPVTLRAALRADRLALAPGILPATPSPVLGNEIRVIRTDFSVNGTLDARQPTPQALQAWRDAGGTIDVDRLELVWGPVRLAGDGTMALDANLQPEGAFAARVSGLADILTALEKAAIIDARTAAIARITLAVLTRPAADGGPPQAQVPLTIQDGVLSVGPVALFKLPRIAWR